MKRFIDGWSFLLDLQMQQTDFWGNQNTFTLRSSFFLRSCWCRIISTPSCGGNTTSPMGCTWRRRTARKQRWSWSKPPPERLQGQTVELLFTLEEETASEAAPLLRRTEAARAEAAVQLDAAELLRLQDLRHVLHADLRVLLFWSALILKLLSSGTSKAFILQNI